MLVFLYVGHTDLLQQTLEGRFGGDKFLEGILGLLILTWMPELKTIRDQAMFLIDAFEKIIG